MAKACSSCRLGGGIPYAVLILNLSERKAVTETVYGCLILTISLHSSSGSKSFQATSKEILTKRKNTLNYGQKTDCQARFYLCSMVFPLARENTLVSWIVFFSWNEGI